MSLFLFRMTEEAVNDAAEVAQIVPDHFLHQIGLRPVDRSGDLEMDCRITRWIAHRLKVFANRAKELASYFFIQRQLRVEMKLAVEVDRAGPRETNVRRAQEELIDRDNPGADMKMHFRLFELELHQFVDLQNLPERDE